MSLSIAIHGDTVLAKRLTAAVRRIAEFDLIESPSADVHIYCDADITQPEFGRGQNHLVLSGPVVRPVVRPAVRTANGVRRLPSPDACAVQRVLEAVRGLGAVRRCFVRIITRTSRATEAGLVDALQPTFDDIPTMSELQALVSGADAADDRAGIDNVEFVVRRVIASYTHSHLLVFKLDFVTDVDRLAALKALQTAPRILVGSGTSDGLPTTAHVQEFFRDQGRPGGERAELFVWQESVLTNGTSLHLMADHSPDSVLLPEMLDAVRQLTGGFESAAAIGPQTDRDLRLWHDLTGPVA